MKLAEVVVDLVANDRSGCITSDGVVCKFKTFIDDLGEETDVPAEAVHAVAHHEPADVWFVVSFNDYQFETVH